MNFKSTIAAVALTTLPTFAAAWDLDPTESVVSFGSIKNDFIGEAHTFSGLSGTVDNDGNVEVSIDLTTLDTNIDIRNERMAEHVFRGLATAEISAEVDLDEIKKLRPGESTQMEIEATLNLLGNDVDVYLDAYVLRVAPNRVMVSTNTAGYLSTEELGVDEGVDVLQGLANLDSITRVTPVTLRLMFER